MTDLLTFIVARLKEPSTYAALATLLGVLHVSVSPGAISDVSFYGAIVAGLAGVVLTERGKPAAQIAADALAAADAAAKAFPKAAAVLALMLGTAFGLAACQNPPTPAQTAGAINVAATIAAYAAQNNTTAADILAKGALVCGVAGTIPGQLVEAGVVAVANKAGVPVSVTNASAALVADACAAIGKVPGPLPDAVAPAAVPLVAVQNAALPPVS